MSVGPLRRVVASAGLLALLPVAWLLAQGALTPEVALRRAGVVLVVVLLIGNVARAVLTVMLRHVETAAGDGATDADDWGGGDRRGGRDATSDAPSERPAPS